MPEAEIFYSLNASIVGLAVSRQGSGNLPQCVGLGRLFFKTSFIFLYKQHLMGKKKQGLRYIMHLCILCSGIVRGVDTLRRVVYIITPVPQHLLEDVDLLLQGFIQIPTCLLQVHYVLRFFLLKHYTLKNPLKCSFFFFFLLEHYC